MPSVCGIHLAPLAIGLLWLSSWCAAAEDSLRVIDNPGGGRVVYGPVQQGTPQAATASALRYVHTHLGQSPVVGTVFESHDAKNYGAFFTVAAKTQADKRSAGLVIVSLAPGAAPATAVLYDNADRFANTEPALLRALTNAWKSASIATASVANANPGSVPPLTPTAFPDGSGAASLPSGWTIPFSSHGAAKIVGPRGELVLLGNTVGPIYDSNNARVQSRLRYANPNQRPILCPDSDALHTYLCLLQRNAPQPPSFQLKNSRPIPVQNRIVQAVLIDADIDVHDGKGILSCELGLRITGYDAVGSRTLGINGTCAPQSLSAQEQPTLKAIFDS